MRKLYQTPSVLWRGFRARDELAGAEESIVSDVDLPIEPGIGDPPEDEHTFQSGLSEFEGYY